MTTSQPRSQTPSRPSDLEALRVEIDRIDEALHGLLMERGTIIDRLIAVKARHGGGSAFRPGREADMMRRLVSRHAGILPLDTVESIWRIIISTFTYVQAPYTVHADVAGGDATMRDSCRFHFGFTVPLATHQGAAQVIAAVAAAGGDLGLVRADQGPDAWWAALAAPAAPKIIARLPFVERADHAAGLPLFVVARPLADAAVSDIALFAAETVSARPHDLAALRSQGIEVIAQHARPGDLTMMLAAPGSLKPEAIAEALARRSQGPLSLAWIGSHARRFELDPARNAGSR